MYKKKLMFCLCWTFSSLEKKSTHNISGKREKMQKAKKQNKKTIKKNNLGFDNSHFTLFD